MSLEGGDDIPNHRRSAVTVVIHGPVEYAASEICRDPADDDGGDGIHRGRQYVAVHLGIEVVYRIDREEGVTNERGRDDAHLLRRSLEGVPLDDNIRYLALGTFQSRSIEAENKSVIEVCPLSVHFVVDACSGDATLRLLLVGELHLVHFRSDIF